MEFTRVRELNHEILLPLIGLYPHSERYGTAHAVPINRIDQGRNFASKLRVLNLPLISSPPLLCYKQVKLVVRVLPVPPVGYTYGVDSYLR